MCLMRTSLSHPVRRRLLSWLHPLTCARACARSFACVPPAHTQSHCTALVTAGRLLSWEHPVTYAAADGSCATAELQPRSQLPLGTAEESWHAAYACAAPVGGQLWKRVRVA